MGGLNSVTLKGYWKSVGGSYGAGETLTVGAVGLVTGNVEISADRSYIALLVLTDNLGNSASYEENIPTEQVTFHLKEGGKGAAFGKAAEQDELLDVAWDARFREDVQVDGALQVGGKSLLDMVYPVGSIYLSVSGTDPETLFGGTWARLEDVFLLAAGAKHTAGSTGGEESHILTEAEIAPHKHAMAYAPESSASSTGFSYGIAAGSATNSAGGRGYESNLGTFSAGGGQPHNNMPPYLAVYTWKRTA